MHVPLPTATQCPLTHGHSGDARPELCVKVVLLAAEAVVNLPLSLGVKAG